MMWRRKSERSSQQSVGNDGVRNPTQDGDSSLSQDSGPQAPLREQGMLEPRNKDLPAGYSSEASTVKFRSRQRAVTTQRSYAVPRGYSISGSIFCTRPVAIHGELEGHDLVAGVVTVMPGGLLRGESRVGTLLAAGLVEGCVQASQLVEVASQCEVRGEIQAPSIDVHPGARLIGASLQVGSH
jgi:cytoskeletal protein CcmA (bactofilin family)